MVVVKRARVWLVRCLIVLLCIPILLVLSAFVSYMWLAFTSSEGYLDSPAELAESYGIPKDYLDFRGTDRFYFVQASALVNATVICGTIDDETKMKLYAMDWDHIDEVASGGLSLPPLPVDMTERLTWRLQYDRMYLDDATESGHGLASPGLEIPGIKFPYPLRGVAVFKKRYENVDLDFYIATTNDSMAIRIAPRVAPR